MKSVYFTVLFGCSFFLCKTENILLRIVKAWNVITIITSLGIRVLIGTPTEISEFELFRQFCVQEFSADLELHDLGALHRGKLGTL